MTNFDEVPLGEALTFSVERSTVEEGRTFSPDAIKTLSAAMIEFILAQVSKRWEQTNEPPTLLTVKIQCEVS